MALSRLTLREKLILGFLVVIVFMGITTSFAGRYLISKMVFAETQTKVLSDLEVAWGIYNELLADVGNKIRLTAERNFLRATMQGESSSAIRRELDAVLRREGLDFLTLADKDGVVFHQAHSPDQASGSIGSHPLFQQARDHDFVQASLILTEDIMGDVWPPIEKSRDGERRGVLALGAAATIFDTSGAVFGVLLGGTIIEGNDEVATLIRDAVFSRELHEGNELGNITLFLGDKRVATTICDNSGRSAEGTSLNVFLARELAEGNDPTFGRNRIMDSWYITAYRPIFDSDGSQIGALGVGVLEARYGMMKDEVVEIFLVLNALGLALALLVSYFLARSITRPVKLLANKAEVIGRGEYTSIDIASEDEIGRFADTFKRMAFSLKDRDETIHDQNQELLDAKKELEKSNIELLMKSEELRRRLKELSVFFDASRKVSSSLSLAEVQSSILDFFMIEFGIDTGSIRMLDDDGFLRIKSSRGLPEEYVRLDQRKPSLDSFAGECFLTNTVIIVEDTDKVQKPISTFMETSGGVKSFCLVPIATDDVVIGVLGCGSKKHRGYFTEKNVDLLNALVQQLSLAMENARLFEKVKTFSEELEKEVVKRTKEVKETTDRLVESDKLADLGAMAEVVAHETRSPIVRVGEYIRKIQRVLPPQDPIRTYIDIVEKEIERLEVMIHSITEYKKYLSTDFEATDINVLVEQALDKVRDSIDEAKVTVQVDFMKSPPMVWVNRRNMEYVFFNLFENSVEAMGEEGILAVTTGMANRNTMHVLVSDTGRGIAKDDIRNVFNPFFTSKISSSGMGLAVTYKIIQDHEGRIKVESTEGEGTTFTIELPIMERE